MVKGKRWDALAGYKEDEINESKCVTTPLRNQRWYVELVNSW